MKDFEDFMAHFERKHGRPTERLRIFLRLAYIAGAHAASSSLQKAVAGQLIVSEAHHEMLERIEALAIKGLDPAPGKAN